MLTNCGVIFFVTIALIILYLCLSSRRNNLCIFISSVLSIIITFIIYSIFSRTNYIPNTFISIINNIYSWLLSTNSTDEKAIFGLGFFYAILYFVIFAICEIISHILISYKEFIRKKKKSYYVIKYILVFGNGIIMAMVIIYTLSIMNIALKIPSGFLNSIFLYIQEGLIEIWEKKIKFCSYMK